MQAKVLSVDSLEDLERALAAFSDKASDAVTALRTEFLHRQAAIDDQEENAEIEVSRWAEALDLAEDDEERELYACALSQAEERLSRIRGWQARVREEHSAFLGRAVGLERLLGQELPRNREFLRSQIGELRAYGAVQPDLEPDAGPAANGSVSGAVPLPPGEVSTPGPARLTDYRLPEGFVWVPLAEISEAELAGITSKGDYRKVPYATMEIGLRRLAAEILPRISPNPDTLDRDSFRLLDEAAGESYEDGLQRVYEAFFCKDFVYLERQKDQEKFSITNGRHRIRVALDLGWDAIPARAKDLRP